MSTHFRIDPDIECFYWTVSDAEEFQTWYNTHYVYGDLPRFSQHDAMRVLQNHGPCLGLLGRTWEMPDGFTRRKACWIRTRPLVVVHEGELCGWVSRPKRYWQSLRDPSFASPVTNLLGYLLTLGPELDLVIDLDLLSKGGISVLNTP